MPNTSSQPATQTTKNPTTANPTTENSTAPLHIVSVSLGSSSRDHAVSATILGRDVRIERRGTDGDLLKARRMIEELDGQVSAIGLGGIDLYVVAGERRYALRDAMPLASAAKITPVVDGSGLKNTLERETVRRLQTERIVDFKDLPVLLVSAVDRFGMAEALVEEGARVVFGDLLFILGLPIPLRRLRTMQRLGALILPVATRLPFKMIYPTGKKQEAIKSTLAHDRFFREARMVAGDFLLIRRFLPDKLEGKIVLTNTTTQSDVELLRARGASRLITTTPEFEGRSFGTNVMEGVFAALGARTQAEYLALLRQLDWQPRIITFENEPQMNPAQRAPDKHG